MKFKLSLLLAVIAIMAIRCTSKQSDDNVTITPEAGGSYKSGDAVSVQAHYSASLKPDSIVYLLDSVKVGSKKDSTALSLKTDSMPLGPRIITARVYSGGKSNEASTNIVLLPSKAPVDYAFKVEKVFPHDTTMYTEGLLYQDGVMYESGGGYLTPPNGEEADGQSSLRKFNVETGKDVKKIMLDPKVFGEGIAVIGDKVIQLTWKEKIAYVYDKSTFKLQKTIPFNVGVEGWGMCFDGKKLYMDDSTNRIWFLDKDDLHQTGFIDVYDDKGPVKEINELEFIDGKIYANVFTTDTIIVIDPKTGAVLERIDLASLYPQDKRSPNANVLNGIAYDAATKRIFITGKKWPKMFQVSFMKK